MPSLCFDTYKEKGDGSEIGKAKREDGAKATEATIQQERRAGTRYSGHCPRNSLARVADRLT